METNFALLKVCCALVLLFFFPNIRLKQLDSDNVTFYFLQIFSRIFSWILKLFFYLDETKSSFSLSNNISLELNLSTHVSIYSIYSIKKSVKRFRHELNFNQEKQKVWFRQTTNVQAWRTGFLNILIKSSL